jgi:hypothetical protein
MKSQHLSVISIVFVLILFTPAVSQNYDESWGEEDESSTSDYNPEEQTHDEAPTTDKKLTDDSGWTKHDTFGDRYITKQVERTFTMQVSSDDPAKFHLETKCHKQDCIRPGKHRHPDGCNGCYRMNKPGKIIAKITKSEAKTVTEKASRQFTESITTSQSFQSKVGGGDVPAEIKAGLGKSETSTSSNSITNSISKTVTKLLAKSETFPVEGRICSVKCKDVYLVITFSGTIKVTMRYGRTIDKMTGNKSRGSLQVYISGIDIDTSAQFVDYDRLYTSCTCEPEQLETLHTDPGDQPELPRTPGTEQNQQSPQTTQTKEGQEHPREDQ